MSMSPTTGRATRAMALAAAAEEAREAFRAAPIGSLEKKALGIRAANALFIAQDAGHALREYSDDQIVELVSRIERSAQAGNPIRYECEREYTDLLHEGRIFICRDGYLDVLGGPLAASDHQIETGEL